MTKKKDVNPKKLAKEESKMTEITDEGANRLACAILSNVYENYVRALKKIMSIGKSQSARSSLELIGALKEKNEDEAFYKSSWFVTLTLGYSKPGSEVIQDIKDSIGFVD